MTSRNKNHLDNHLKLVLFSLIIGAALLKISGYDTFAYTIWSDRDLLRAAQLFDDFQVSGAELYLTHGARSPGAAIYYFFNLILSVNDSPVFLYLVSVAFDLLATFIIFQVFKKYFNFNYGLIAAALYSVSPNVVGSISMIWNPSFLPFFSVLCFLFIYKIFVEKSYNYVPALFFTTFIGMQFHLGLFIVIVFFLALLFACPIRPSIRQIGLALLLAVVTLLPYFVVEFQNNFENTHRIFINNAHTIADSRNVFTNFFSVVWQTILQVRIHHTIIYNILYGDISPTFFGLVFFVSSVLIVVGFLGYFIFLISKLIRNRHANDLEEWRQRSIVALVVIYGAGLLTTQIFTNQQTHVEGRYVLPYLPAAIGLMTLLLIDINGWIQTALSGILRKSVSAAFSIAVLIGAGYWSLAYFSPNIGLTNDTFNTPNFRYSFVKDVVETTRNEFKFSKQKLERAVALATPIMIEGKIKIRLVSNTFTSYSYLVSRLPSLIQNGAEPYVGCALYVLKKDHKFSRFDTAPGKTLAIKRNSVGDDLIVTVERVIKRDDFVLIGFRSIHENCPRTFANGYDFSKNEKTIARSASRLAVNTAMGEPSPDAHNHVYIMRLQNPATEIGGADIGVRLTLRLNGSRVSALVESGDLTGPVVTPPSGDLLDSTLIFVNKKSGATFHLPIIRGVLGGDGPFTSPWQTTSIPLKTGDYSITFQGRVSTGRELLSKSVDVSIQIDDHFLITNEAS